MSSTVRLGINSEKTIIGYPGDDGCIKTFTMY